MQPPKLRVAPSRFQYTLPYCAYTTWQTDNGQVWLECVRTDTVIILRFPGYADYHIGATRTSVLCYPCPDIDNATLDHLFKNQVVPLLLNASGYHVFHGASVTFGAGAIAFLGSSGLGKSTLATAFAQNGAPFLSDDVVLINSAPDGFIVYPGDASIRLWGTSRDHFFDQNRATEPPISYTRKSRLAANDDLPFCHVPRLLHAAFFLRDDAVDKPVIEPLTGQDAHLAWVGHSFLLEPDKRNVIAANFGAAAELATRLPCFTLDYPRDFTQLCALMEYINAFVEDLGT